MRPFVVLLLVVPLGAATLERPRQLQKRLHRGEDGAQPLVGTSRDAGAALTTQPHATVAAGNAQSPWVDVLRFVDPTILYDDGARGILGVGTNGTMEATTISWKRGFEMASGTKSKADPSSAASDDGEVLVFLYMGTAAVVASIIIFIFQSQGLWVIMSVLAYVFALATMEIDVKWVFAVTNFQFPLFLTASHMFCSATTGFALLAYRSWKNGEPLVVPTSRELCFKFIPLASCIAWSIGTANIALVFCSASFAEMMGATTPIVTVCIVLLMGMPFNWCFLGPVGLVFAGCSLAVVGEVNFSLIGFALCFIANVGRATKVVLEQELMAGATKAKFDPCAVLAWMCGCASCFMFIFSSVMEGSAPYMRFMAGPGQAELCRAVLVSCLNAVILNLAALFVTRNLGAIGAQLVAQVKSVLTVLGSMVLFGDHVPQQEMVGFAFVLLGTYTYSRMDQAIKKQNSTLPLEQRAGQSPIDACKP